MGWKTVLRFRKLEFLENVFRIIWKILIHFMYLLPAWTP
jgi:hypothetical protein